MTQDFYETVACAICGSREYKVVYPATRKVVSQDQIIAMFKSSGDEPLTEQMVQCTQCGLLYVNPRLKASLIIGGYSAGDDAKFVSQEEGRMRTFVRCLREIERYCPPGKVLDIGTAGGTFLAAAQRRGWIPVGIEPNKWLCDWGKRRYGVDIRQGTLDQQHFTPGSFDVVTLWDVLEHVPDPTKTLTDVAAMVKPGGHLVVNYPDMGSWIARLMGKRWVFVLNVHLYYFTQQTMKKLLDKVGFDVVRVKPHLQTLSLGYLCFRMHAYNRFLSKIGQTVTKYTMTENLQIPYWVGQTFVMARKR